MKKQINWRIVPMVRLLLPLIAGIYLGTKGDSLLIYWRTGGLLLLLVCLILLLPRTPFHKRWWYGLVINAFFLLFGYSLIQTKVDNQAVRGDAIHSPVIATVISNVPTAQKQRLLVSINETISDSIIERTTADKLLAYLEKDTNSLNLMPGDVIALEGQIHLINPPMNPNAFNYQQYMLRRGVYHQVYIKEGNWAYLGYESGIRRTSAIWRRYFLNILQKHIPEENEYAVAAALSLGYKSGINEKIRNAYADTGAMHVLAVSGLHVGLVQLIISYLLSFIRPRWRGWKYFKTILIILSIWAFAVLTGSSPSVLRAATMFSFLAVGIALQRVVNIYNTLAASAFLLLCINPFFLFEAGFQLSYLAVIGIVYFQPKIYRSWYIGNAFGRYLWKLGAVSLAAQITTLPISLYYFHQLPLYFILSGLVVVPAAALILSLCILLFMLQGIPLIALLIGKVLFGVLYATNALIFLIQQMPGSLLEGIWINALVVILLYAIIICIVVSIEARSYRYILYGLFFLLSLSVNNAFRQWKIQHQQALVIYQIHSESLLDYFSGKDRLSLVNRTVSTGAIKHAARLHRWHRGNKKGEKHSFGDEANSNDYYLGKGFAQLGPYRILMPGSEPPQITDSLCLDVLLLKGKESIPLEDYLSCIYPKHIVIDGSAGWRNESQWQKICNNAGYSPHITSKEGAFILEFN